MLPSQRYNELMSRKRFSRDLTQEHAIVVLDGVFKHIIAGSHANKFSIFNPLSWKNKNKKPIKGCYLWGGVGRGKTFIMDLFYDVLPIKDKQRLHFHHFMKDIHERLSLLDKVKNPLKIIAEQLSKEFSVLCLDEFMVHDIGDAMVLSELLSGMSEFGITLLTTSNTAPENLYLDGLQRSQFLATIRHINQHCHVLHVDGGYDYRAKEKIENTVYYSPHSEQSMNCIHQWLELNQYPVKPLDSITIQSREIESLFVAKQAIWFEFSAICKTNRSRSDYIELTERFRVIVISGLHVMDDQANDVIRRFITLVDVLYDNKTILLISADVNIEALYEGSFLKFEFRRTMSRLYEMQAKHYLASN